MIFWFVEVCPKENWLFCFLLISRWKVQVAGIFLWVHFSAKVAKWVLMYSLAFSLSFFWTMSYDTNFALKDIFLHA